MGSPLWRVEVFSDKEVIFKPGADILKPTSATLIGASKSHSRDYELVLVQAPTPTQASLLDYSEMVRLG